MSVPYTILGREHPKKPPNPEDGTFPSLWDPWGLTESVGPTPRPLTGNRWEEGKR